MSSWTIPAADVDKDASTLPTSLPTHYQTAGARMTTPADVQQGLAEWRCIQDVVQLTFQAFFDALRTQGDAIKGLEKSRDQFATSLRAEMASALRAKASGQDLTARLAEMETRLNLKADTTDMERRALRTEMEASTRTQMLDVMALIKARTEECVTRAWQENCERQLAALRADVTKLSSAVQEVRNMLSSKASSMDVTTALASKADAADVDARLRDKVCRKLHAEDMAGKADAAVLERCTADLRARVDDVATSLSSKADSCRTDEVSRAVERLSNRVDADAHTTSATLLALTNKFDTVLQAQTQAVAACQAAAEQLSSSARDEARCMLADVEQRHAAAISRKADSTEVARLLSEARAEVAGLRDAVGTRATNTAVAALEATLAQLSVQLPRRVGELQQEVASKLAAGQQAINQGLAAKASVADVNTALAQVCADLSSRAPAEQLDSLALRLHAMSDSVADLSLTARWLWQSGNLLTPSGQVPWEVQAVNANPSLFVWEPGQPVVVATLPGLYRLSVAMFSAARPILLQVLLNSEPLLAATGPGHTSSASLLVHRPAHAGDAAIGPLHSAGNVLGLSVNEFVSLPPNAQLSVVFQGDPTGSEGFFMLQKL